jgi:hypothetical protein
MRKVYLYCDICGGEIIGEGWRGIDESFADKMGLLRLFTITGASDICEACGKAYLALDLKQMVIGAIKGGGGKKLIDFGHENVVNKDRSLCRGKLAGYGRKGEWVTGYITEYPDGHITITTGLEKREFGTAYSVLPETAGQCTGIADKNGRPIFQGDYIKYGGERYSIAYGDACFWIQQGNASIGDSYTMELHTILGNGDIEVVGNVHDGIHADGTERAERQFAADTGDNGM